MREPEMSIALVEELKRHAFVQPVTVIPEHDSYGWRYLIRMGNYGWTSPCFRDDMLNYGELVARGVAFEAWHQLSHVIADRTNAVHVSTIRLEKIR